MKNLIDRFLIYIKDTMRYYTAQLLLSMFHSVDIHSIKGGGDTLYFAYT